MNRHDPQPWSDIALSVLVLVCVLVLLNAGLRTAERRVAEMSHTVSEGNPNVR